MKIKTGDTVIVKSGHYKGTTGEVKAVNRKTNKIIVEGVNILTANVNFCSSKTNLIDHLTWQLVC